MAPLCPGGASEVGVVREEEAAFGACVMRVHLASHCRVRQQAWHGASLALSRPDYGSVRLPVQV